MLNSVRTPRSLRTGAACFIAAWCAGANMKPRPSLSIACPVSAGVSAMLAPSASSTSALPEDDDTERPMCFATFAPAAAATNAAQVDTLKVCARVAAGAAGVDQVAVVRDLHLRGQLAHHLRRGGDFADGLLLHAQADDEAGDLRRAELAAHDLAHDVQHLVVEHLAVLHRALDRLGDGDLLHASGSLDEILQQLVPVLGEQRLRMELHAFDREAAVAQAHDLAILGLGADLEAGGQRRALDDQRVIAGGDELIFDAGENPRAIMADARSLAVHHLLRAHHLAAERLADGLVAEAHAEDRNAPGQALDGLQRDPRLVRRARAGRQDQVGGRHGFDAFHRQFVIAHHAHFGTELAEVLHQVEGKRIVVVDHQNHDVGIQLILLT